ncbi:hypothetical protein ACSSS7_001914 [Eimeria intestinalis]
MQNAAVYRALRAVGACRAARTPTSAAVRAVIPARPVAKPGFCSAAGVAQSSSVRSLRGFFSSGRSAPDRHSVEGRYGYALHAAAQEAKALDQVHADVQGLNHALQASPDFAEFARTPGITAETKVSVVQQVADRFKLHKITKNFLGAVAENKRMADLPKMLGSFEELYRATRGEVRCSVTSAKELTSEQRKEVIAALQKRAGPKATILAEFNTSPSIVGGLLVRMGDEVLDYSIATRVESLRTSLMAPLNV